MKKFTLIFCVLIIQQVCTAGEILHVDNSLSFRNAVREANTGRDISEIVLAEGVYRLNVEVKSNPDPGRADLPLTIRAADGAKVIIDGGSPVVSWEPHADMPGVYVATVTTSRREAVKVWNSAKRHRYTLAATPQSVARFPGTYYQEGSQLILHTPDGSDPSNSDIRVGRLDYGMYIKRSNVTIKNLNFRDFVVRDKWSTAIKAAGNRLIIEGCTVFNASIGLLIEGSSSTVRNCRIDDTGGAIYSNGINITVEDCQLFKRRDGFMIHMYDQDDTGIQFYYPARGGTVKGNLVVGYNMGVFIKCHTATYIIENNTLVGNGLKAGIATTRWAPTCRFRYNIVNGHNKPVDIHGLKDNRTIDHNIYWSISTSGYEPIGANDIVADPMFVAPQWNDYRLKANSPGLNVVRNKTIGAFPAAEEENFRNEAARNWHVAVDGVDGASGDEGQPLLTIQHAVDRARPGDTILVHPGIYPSPVIFRRGGTKDRPIVLKSVEKWGAVLDSNRKADVMIDLKDAPYIEFHDFEIRWFKQIGIRLKDSPNITVNGCRIWNDHWYAAAWPTGYGIRGEHSPGLTVHRSVFLRLDYGVWIYHCANSTMTYNTGLANLHPTFVFLYSTDNSICKNNSMTYCGSEAIEIHIASDLKMVEPTFQCDYNNYGAALRDLNDGRPYDSIEPRSEEAFLNQGSKAIGSVKSHGGQQHRPRTMEAWRKLTGLDEHSIFANPLHVNVITRDLRLEPDSPNIGAGEDGTTIGALDVR